MGSFSRKLFGFDHEQDNNFSDYASTAGLIFWIAVGVMFLL